MTGLLLAAALVGLVGCAQEEEAPPPAWFVQSWMSASRRYALTGPDGQRAGAIKRSGAVFALLDPAGRRLAKASLRRVSQSVVLRDGGGAVVGHTRADKGRVEVVGAEDKVIAALARSAANAPWQLTGADGAVLAEAETVDDHLVVRFQPGGTVLHGSPQGSGPLVSLTSGDHDARVLLALDVRAGFSPHGLAILSVEALSPAVRLGLAVHLESFGVIAR